MRMKLNILKVYILAVLLLVVCFFAFGFNKGEMFLHKEEFVTL